MDKEHKDPDTIDLGAPRRAQYMHMHGRNIKTQCIVLTSNLRKRKDLSSIKHDLTQSSFTKRFQFLVFWRLSWWNLEKSFYEKVYASSRPPPKISFRDDWMKELGSEVAGGVLLRLSTNPTKIKTLLFSTKRFVKSCVTMSFERLDKDKDADENKLLISSKLFISCKGTIDLTSLRLDNFIQFWNTSFVMIGLELVFLNLCMIISEKLLFPSFQKHPDLLILWVATRIFSDVWIWWSENRFPCSNMTDRQRLTGQQAFVKRVISLSTARWIFPAPEWTVVKRALCRWWSHGTLGHADLRACRRWRTPGWMCQ